MHPLSLRIAVARESEKVFCNALSKSDRKKFSMTCPLTFLSFTFQLALLCSSPYTALFNIYINSALLLPATELLCLSYRTDDGQSKRTGIINCLEIYIAPILQINILSSELRR